MEESAPDRVDSLLREDEAENLNDPSKPSVLVIDDNADIRAYVHTLLNSEYSITKLANMMHLSNPIGIILVYLGFGAGLAVFMFCGFVKSIPLEIEEAAMIDGCTPLQTFFQVVFPIMKPTTITVAILQAMWIWNDYLLPYLVLDLKKYKTIPIVIQYLKGGYGAVDWGTMMAMLVLAIVPIIIFYAACQKYIIEGVVAGAVKG